MAAVLALRLLDQQIATMEGIEPELQSPSSLSSLQFKFSWVWGKNMNLQALSTYGPVQS